MMKFNLHMQGRGGKLEQKVRPRRTRRTWPILRPCRCADGENYPKLPWVQWGRFRILKCQLRCRRWKPKTHFFRSAMPVRKQVLMLKTVSPSGQSQAWKCHCTYANCCIYIIYYGRITAYMCHFPLQYTYEQIYHNHCWKKKYPQMVLRLALIIIV